MAMANIYRAICKDFNKTLSYPDVREIVTIEILLFLAKYGNYEETNRKIAVPHMFDSSAQLILKRLLMKKQEFYPYMKDEEYVALIGLDQINVAFPINMIIHSMIKEGYKN